jgi:hypothetical protein
MSLAFSPDGAMLASADGDTAIRISNARTGVLRSTVSELLLESLALGFSRVRVIAERFCRITVLELAGGIPELSPGISTDEMRVCDYLSNLDHHH